MELTREQQELVELAKMVQVDNVPAAKRALEALLVDEEELTPETIASIQEAEASLARGEGIPHEEILREFGLS